MGLCSVSWTAPQHPRWRGGTTAGPSRPGHHTTGTSKSGDHCSSATTITKLVGEMLFGCSAPRPLQSLGHLRPGMAAGDLTRFKAPLVPGDRGALTAAVGFYGDAHGHRQPGGRGLEGMGRSATPAPERVGARCHGSADRSSRPATTSRARCCQSGSVTATGSQRPPCTSDATLSRAQPA
jgi:hypothetical protein